MARDGRINPVYSDGELVKVTRASHQAEAEWIQELLLEEGVPSLLRRSRGFDVPDMLAAGPRDVLVPESGVTAAREVLLQAELLPPDGPATGGVDRPSRILLGLVAALVLVAIVAWIGTELLV